MAAKLVVAAVGLAFVLILSGGVFEWALRGENDFAAFYMGGKLAGTPELWQPMPYFEFMQEQFGAFNDALTFVRPPFYAMMLWPLAQLPYESAYLIWVVLRVGALAGFVLLWRLPSRLDALLFTAVSLPAATGILCGQDSAFVLFFAAAGIALERNGRPLVAGLALSLCAIKFNLLLPLPLLFVAQRRWDIVKGFSAGAVALLALSFLGGGWGWMADYWAVVTSDRTNPAPTLMPNLHGLLYSLSAGPLLEWVISAALLAATWVGLKRTDFVGGMALVFMSGLLITPHAYTLDCILLIPAALTILTRYKSPLIMAATMALLWPPIYLMLLSESPWRVVMPLALIAYFGLSVWAMTRQPAPAQGVAAEPAVSA